ncbi:hypothetical protein [Ramlibacter sp.]|uniref:hypothetical protein n=1 Tax=Ramlibacter sp. TaxID=1917967 RepID=UPI002607FD90|nr:hypothetical protein [Ramlibacter sp.]MDB5956044.1 hypothetical protein [Ramlibacter sp.]
MNPLHHLDCLILTHRQAAPGRFVHGHARPGDDADPLVQGAQLALQAYTRASDAYAQSFVSPSVALWSLLIAAGVVLLEWLVARTGRQR